MSMMSALTPSSRPYCSIACGSMTMFVPLLDLISKNDCPCQVISIVGIFALPWGRTVASPASETKKIAATAKGRHMVKNLRVVASILPHPPQGDKQGGESPFAPRKERRKVPCSVG